MTILNSCTTRAEMEAEPTELVSDLDFARQLLNYIDAAPTPCVPSSMYYTTHPDCAHRFHLVAESVARLEQNGFVRLSETEPWSGADGNKVSTRPVRDAARSARTAGCRRRQILLYPTSVYDRRIYRRWSSGGEWCDRSLQGELRS